MCTVPLGLLVRGVGAAEEESIALQQTDQNPTLQASLLSGCPSIPLRLAVDAEIDAGTPWYAWTSYVNTRS